MERTIRLSIVEQALADVVERLSDLPPSRDADDLRKLAKEYETQMAGGGYEQLDEQQRAAFLKGVLDLNVEVMRAGGDQSPPDSEEED